MSKAGILAITVGAIAAIGFWWASNSDPSAPTVDNTKTTLSEAAMPGQALETPSSRQHIELFELGGDVGGFSIVIDSSRNWNFEVTNRQSHPNGDISYSGKNLFAATALVTRGQRRMYATVVDGGQLYEITSDQAGELIDWRQFGPGDVNLEGDFIEPRLTVEQTE